MGHPLTQMFRTMCLGSALVGLVWISPDAGAAGLLKPVGSQYQDMQIQSHHVDVVIQDGYATTAIEQTFYNPNSDALEALYSFPVPQQAVVGEFIYWINDVPVIAEAVPKQKAREIYQDQKAQGNATALTEKDDYKHFDMRVFPVQPLQSVKVRLVYMQDALLDHGVGRYLYPLEEGGVDEARDSFWQRNPVVEQDFSFNVTLRSAYPVDGMRLPSHPDVEIHQEMQAGAALWLASLTNQAGSPDTGAIESAAANESVGSAAVAVESGAEHQHKAMRLDKDILLYWRLQEGLPGRVDMVTYRDPKASTRGTVKLTFTPGDDLGPVTEGRDWVFVLDKSGSMNGKYATLVEGVRQGLGKLPAQDRFRIILFDEGTQEFSKGFVPVDSNNINQALAWVEGISPGNGTDLYQGLKRALTPLDADRPTGVVLVTDGVANVGVTEKRRFFELMQQQDVRLFTFIMGNSANTPLLVPMTRLSNGVATSVSNADDMVGHLMNITSKLTHQAYRNIRLDIDGVKIKDLTPQEIGSLYRGEQLVLFGHYFAPGEAKLTLTMDIGGESRKYSTTVMLPETALDYPELERMWAFSAINGLQEQMDYLEQKDRDKEKAIEDIAIEYGLLTDYTSLLVVEEDIFRQLGIERDNQRRVSKEQAARKTRETQPPAPTRADKQNPMFSEPQPTHSGGGGGGGSMGLWTLLALLLLGAVRLVAVKPSR
ncbi:VIT and vWA domain-containing protein [Shewanella zhangzhouensis]|uniref:VIT and vWA domain-containing protein n=1 Tax=Shewanella zhangzhouensis TaxID=2864213 RepID=UPI001C6619CD|nr:VIT and VWA domain-containing protein [Shewanella zhangzhouensis]QYK04733.1 VIT and VWA domain-containing protein [Shewanella zhangzhouensis]